jgi:cytochrome c-type biogenesis protein CcmH/NrfF
VGVYSDVGGGYATGDLSDVALMGMVEQAGKQKVKIRKTLIHENGWDVVTDPEIHDSNTSFWIYGFGDLKIHTWTVRRLMGRRKTTAEE